MNNGMPIQKNGESITNIDGRDKKIIWKCKYRI